MFYKILSTLIAIISIIWAIYSHVSKTKIEKKLRSELKETSKELKETRNQLKEATSSTEKLTNLLNERTIEVIKIETLSGILKEEKNKDFSIEELKEENIRLRKTKKGR